MKPLQGAFIYAIKNLQRIPATTPSRTTNWEEFSKWPDQHQMIYRNFVLWDEVIADIGESRWVHTMKELSYVLHCRYSVSPWDCAKLIYGWHAFDNCQCHTGSYHKLMSPTELSARRHLEQHECLVQHHLTESSWYCLHWIRRSQNN